MCVENICLPYPLSGNVRKLPFFIQPDHNSVDPFDRLYLHILTNNKFVLDYYENEQY